MAEIKEATTGDVRAWARRKGYPVGQRGHIDRQVIAAFNRAHRVQQYTSKNPSDGYMPADGTTREK